jgi:hypothetical protein
MRRPPDNERTSRRSAAEEPTPPKVNDDIHADAWTKVGEQADTAPIRRLPGRYRDWTTLVSCQCAHALPNA